MAGLSGFTTMAGMAQLLPGELDQALRRRFGRPATCRTYPVYGFGVDHASGRSVVSESVERLAAKHHLSDQRRNEVRLRFEWELLNASEQPPPPKTWPNGVRPAQSFATGANDFGQNLLEWTTDSKAHDRAMLSREYLDFLNPLNEALGRAEISGQELLRDGSDDLTAFLT